LLTRELLYTGVSRAREQLTIVATEAALRTAVTTVISRASGLADRL
jgi:exodeoxyribonuclease V alpha subunit